MTKRRSDSRNVRNAKRSVLIEHVLWNWMTGSLIGLLGAALLLVAHPSAGEMVFTGTSVWLSEALVLATSGFFCGCGATLTGAVFLLIER